MIRTSPCSADSVEPLQGAKYQLTFERPCKKVIGLIGNVSAANWTVTYRKLDFEQENQGKSEEVVQTND